MHANDKWHQLEDPFDARYFRVHVRRPAGVSSVALLRSEVVPDEALVATRVEGRVDADVVWTDATPVVLFTERLVKIFEEEGFSGWSTYPVEFVQDGVNSKYVGFSVTGRCGPLDFSRGEWVRKDNEPGRFLRGLFFDAPSWDGSDFFSPISTAYIFVTPRVRDRLEREAVKNIKVERLIDVLTPEEVIRNTKQVRTRNV